MKKFAISALVGASILSVVGCQSTDTAAVKAPVKKAVAKVVNNNDLFEVAHVHILMDVDHLFSSKLITHSHSSCSPFLIDVDH